MPVLTGIILISTILLWLLTACTDPGASLTDATAVRDKQRHTEKIVVSLAILAALSFKISDRLEYSNSKWQPLHGTFDAAVLAGLASPVLFIFPGPSGSGFRMARCCD